MKKLALVALSLVCVLMAGCGNATEGSTAASSETSMGNVENSNHFSGEMTIIFSYGERTGTYEGEINDEGLPNGTGKFTSKTTDGYSWTYSGEWKNGHWEGNGSAIWADGSQYVGEYSNDAAKGNGTFTFPNGAKFVGVFSANYDAVGTYYPIDGDPIEATMVNGDVFSNETEPDSTSFFSNKENRTQYEELYKSYRYAELKELVQTYINTNEVTSDDVAYTLLDYIEPVLPYEDKWYADLDEFDSKYEWSFDDADSINQYDSVAVFLKGTDLDIMIGFQKNGWLFFDKIALSIDGEEVYSKSDRLGERTRTVISGNLIMEYCFCNFNSKVLESVGKAETVILRFSNKKSGENFDHTLSQEEKDALYCGYLLRINNRDLSDLLSNYRRDNNIND